MKAWPRKLVKVAFVTACVLTCMTVGVIWYGNREVPEPTLAEKQQSLRRAVEWIRAHEASVLKNGNSALWWMVHTAAERTGDEYLKSLVRQSTLLVYGSSASVIPWKRIIYPQADITLNLLSLRGLAPYQRFFYHAVTCRPVDLDDGGDTSEFLEPGVCHPIALQVYAKDPACTTHQLVGVRLLQRVGCPTEVDLAKLESNLLADIEQQMQWDVIFKDAYIQRVLMLLWLGRPHHQVKPVWLHRVLAAQQADGGWVGTRQMPELPQWLQTWNLGKQRAAPTDFHATAQGLLIAALAVTEKGR